MVLSFLKDRHCDGSIFIGGLFLVVVIRSWVVDRPSWIGIALDKGT